MRALGLAGRYEPYRLICRWLNVKRPGRCAPWRAQGGWMLHMAFSYKAKAFRTTSFFPLFQHTAFYFPPSDESDGFETIFCLECLQILNALHMAGGSTLKLEIGHCALY